MCSSRVHGYIDRYGYSPGPAFPRYARVFRLVISSAYASPVRIAEVMLLRLDDKPNPRPGIKWRLQKSGTRAFWDWPPQGTAVLDDEYPADGAMRLPKQRDCRSHVENGCQRPTAMGRAQGPLDDFAVRLHALGPKDSQFVHRAVAGYEADMLSSAGIDSHFKHLVEPLLAVAPECVGRSLKTLHIDSYEIGADVAGLQPTWSHIFREEFRKRRGYDVLRYLPALAGRIVDSREITDRFLWDIRRTIADLMAKKFWGRYVELTHRHGLKAKGETGYGSYPLPQIDSLQCAGALDVPMGEFWLHETYMTQLYPFCHTIRTVANAAHVYGRPVVQAEAFTTFSHFMESPADLKALGDEQFCAGLNRMVFHQSTHQAQLDFKPGYQYNAGTHIDRCLTWWDMAAPYFQYLARCQYLLQAGRFYADFCYFYGEGAAAYVPAKDHLNPPLPPGYDFDAINADVLLNRLRVEDEQLVLPNGQRYLTLVLPTNRQMSPRMLKKIVELVEAGANVIGQPPLHAPGLTDYPQCDAELKSLADRLWGLHPRPIEYAGKGTIGQDVDTAGFDFTCQLSGSSSASSARFWKVSPEFQKPSTIFHFATPRFIDFIHRTTPDAEIYFVASRSPLRQSLDCVFAVTGQQPEIWDPVSGKIRDAGCFEQGHLGTFLPLEFAPNGSLFIVFRKPIPTNRQGTARSNFPTFHKLSDLAGPWTVHFDPKWGGPESIAFEKLEDWTKRPEEGVKFYSGKATYVREFELSVVSGQWSAVGGPAAENGPHPNPLPKGEGANENSPRPQAGEGAGRLFLDLGVVKNIAQVRLNGKSLGVVWTAPWRVEITDVVKPTDNRLEIDVVNLWPNRIMHDWTLPLEKRLTKTNVTYPKDQPLLPSGLLGPVTLQKAE